MSERDIVAAGKEAAQAVETLRRIFDRFAVGDLSDARRGLAAVGYVERSMRAVLGRYAMQSSPEQPDPEAA